MFFSEWYEITDDPNIKEIWRPMIAFEHLLDYKKTKVYGGHKPFFFWYTNGWGEKIIYHEEVQLSFSCPFHFETYPFDSHVCILEMACPTWPSNKLMLKPNNIIYDHGSQPIKHSLGEDPIIFTNIRHPYEFEFKFLSTFEKTDAYNYTSSYVGIEIKMKRITLGELLIGYYYPMAAFAILSMISFLINPDVVSCNCYFH